MTAIVAQQDDADMILSRADPRWQRLHEIISEKSLKLGNFVLTSGATSKYLFQLRQTTMLPEGAALIGEAVVEYMQRCGLACVGGLELGAVPLVAAIAVASYYKSYPVDAFFVRKTAKAHGAKERIDGHVRIGGEVLMIDDVATSGKSILAAVDAMKEEYPTCVVRRAFAVIDRQEGATRNLAEHGIELASLFKTRDFPIDI